MLSPNRVWRTYRGGRILDELAGVAQPADGHFPEDWVGSITRAINPGRDEIVEGVSRVLAGGKSYDLQKLLTSARDYFFGRAHVEKFGTDPRMLVKLLDSSVRLHFQVHPTAAFAQKFLGSPSGKTEAYHVLATRPEVTAPYIYLGFQRPPSRDALRSMIERQDIAALKACFDKIPVNPGDTYLVPGGVPHALGEGVFLVEIQEPSDLVVRFEFERAGYTLPESARFMNRGLEFCLDIFDRTPRSLSDVAAHFRCPPRASERLAPHAWRDELIGPAQTPCFRLKKTHLHEPVTLVPDGFSLGIVTAGKTSVEAAGSTYRLNKYDKFLVPAGIGPLRFNPEPSVEILECDPPLVA